MTVLVSKSGAGHIPSPDNDRTIIVMPEIFGVPVEIASGAAATAVQTVNWLRARRRAKKLEKHLRDTERRHEEVMKELKDIEKSLIEPKETTKEADKPSCH